MIDFIKERYNDNYTVVNNQLYVEYGMRCQCKCEFCRNKTELSQKVCLDEIDQTIKNQYSKYRRVIFGGGEPLFELPRIMRLIKTIKEEEGDISEREKVRFHLVTNGEKALFEKYLKSEVLKLFWATLFSGNELDTSESQNCSNCHLFDKIILSRHHYDDARNQEIFNSSSQLLSNDDLKSLCGKQKKGKIQLNCICQRGEIDSLSEIMEFVLWALELGFTNILFSNLDTQTTPKEYFAEKNMPPEFWMKIHRTLDGIGEKTRENHVIYTSSGYKTTSYYFTMTSFMDNFLVDDNDECIVTIKEYCDFDNTVISKSNHFNFDYTVRPNGSIVMMV